MPWATKYMRVNFIYLNLTQITAQVAFQTGKKT
uniref:Uncharacterized protein n=1 Tax=Anguilla anguilla TaxID=7936 RepID=A0A0E9TI51_ANGAN